MDSRLAIKGKARPQGRPKAEWADGAILRATDDILSRNGYRATTVDAIAKQAGVAKTTIYRRWKDKASVVIDAVRTTSQLGRSIPEGGSLRSDLEDHLSDFVRMLRGSTGRKFRAMFSEAQNDPALAAAFREKILWPGRLITIAALERGIARGEVRRNIELSALSDSIYGAIYYRLLLAHGPLDKKFIKQLLDVIFIGARAGG